MNRSELFKLIQKKQSFLCVGLDSDITKIPQHLLGEEDPVFAFNKAIINATLPYTVAYKPNLAFYESRGIAGLRSLERTMTYLNQYRNEVFTIADAKRGDIGNTSKQYARAFFDTDSSGFSFDSVTVAPYMGADSITPFLSFNNHWVILLALTSNQGAFDFQFRESGADEEKLFEAVIKKSADWGGTPDNMMFVVGATKAEMLADIRTIAPHHFLLVPGVGAQGGSLEAVAQYGLNKQCGLLVNSSRGIIFASSADDFAQVAANKAHELQQQMATILGANDLV